MLSSLCQASVLQEILHWIAVVIPIAQLFSCIRSKSIDSCAHVDLGAL